jgi:hypothetical protein
VYWSRALEYSISEPLANCNAPERNVREVGPLGVAVALIVNHCLPIVPALFSWTDAGFIGFSTPAPK